MISEGPAEDFEIFEIRRHLAVSPRTGETHERVRIHAPDWVNVIAITPRDEVVLVEEFRHGIQDVSLELPGGVIEASEGPLEAGLRELREETGYAGASPVLLGSLCPNPAHFTNQVHFLFVAEATQVGALELDSGEDIAVRTVPRSAIPGLIQRGEITHALHVAAFHCLELWERTRKPE